MPVNKEAQSIAERGSSYMNIWKELLGREEMTEEEKKTVCNSLMTKEARMERLILKHFSTEDFRKVWERRIGEGLIGGCLLYTSRCV